MSSSQLIPEELLQLIHASFTEALTDEEVPKLEQGLSENQQAQRLFIRLSRLNARLGLQFQVDEAFREVREEVLASKSNNRTTILGHALPELRERFPRSLHSHLLCYTATAMLAASVTVLIFINQEQIAPQELITNPTTLPVEVAANVRGSHEAEWQVSDSPITPTTRELQLGEMVRLQKGLLMLDFLRGGSCLIEGPSVFEVSLETGGKLYDGQMVVEAAYDSPQVLLETRVADVIAENAKVAVSAKDSGDAVVMVLEGNAEVQLGKRSQRPVTIQLTAGESLNLYSDGTFREKPGLESPSFTQEFPTSEPKFTGDVIWLGNLFDDSTTSSMDQAMLTDTYQAAAETIDLGVAAVIDGGLDVDVPLAASGVVFNFANYGGRGGRTNGLPANDTYRSVSPIPIRTTGKHFQVEWSFGKKFEEGIGMCPNMLMTFDLDEIRRASDLGNTPMRFVVDRAGINDDINFLEIDLPSSVRLFALVSDENDVFSGYVNGVLTDVVKRSGTYSFELTDKQRDDPAYGEIKGNRYVSFNIAIPSHAKFLTLVSVAGSFGTNGDHSVFSGARLEIVDRQAEPDESGI